jgi:uncharacterized membrane protein
MPRNGTQEHTPEKQDLRAEKKMAVVGSPRPSLVRPVAMVAALALLLVGAVAAALLLYPSAPDGPALALAASADGAALPLADLADGRARHYDWTTDDGIRVRYFVLQSSDGVIRAAFDACDVCWPSGLGYEQDGDAMICRNCGSRFSSTRVGVVRGGCNPAPLETRIQDDRILIRAADLQQGRRYFDLKS